MTNQQDLESRYAQVVGAETAVFTYADRVDAALVRSGVTAVGDRLIDMIGGPGLRVADARAAARDVHADGGLLWADITVPSHFGCRAFDLGVDVQCEALDRVAAGALGRKVVAVSTRDSRAAARMTPALTDVLAAEDLRAIARGLDTMDERMQRHFDHARALAEYLSCCERLVGTWYPGLSTHPDHERATRVLLHGFGPAIDFELPVAPAGHAGASAPGCTGCASAPGCTAAASAPGRTAGDFIDRCRLSGRACKAGGFHTRLHARDGRDGRVVRIFAGLDNPLEIADDLDQAMRWFCNPPQP